jgi:hypothetical protein
MVSMMMLLTTMMMLLTMIMIMRVERRSMGCSTNIRILNTYLSYSDGS